MTNVRLVKKLGSKSTYVPDLSTWNDRFIPVYKIYVDDRLVGEYLNIYEAARELERQCDLNAVNIELEKNPYSFESAIHVDEKNLINFTKQKLSELSKADYHWLKCIMNMLPEDVKLYDNTSNVVLDEDDIDFYIKSSNE